MDQKTFSTAVLVIGIVILVVSLFADSIGIGDSPGFGIDQAIGSVVGVAVTGVGLFLTVQAKKIILTLLPPSDSGAILCTKKQKNNA